MTDNIIEFPVFPRSQAYQQAMRAVAAQRSEDFESRFYALYAAVREMRLFQHRRERDMAPQTWDTARTLERQVDAMLNDQPIY